MRTRAVLTLVAFSGFCFSSALARLNQINARSHDHPAIARRQRQVPRLLSDTCAQLKAAVLTNAMLDLVDSFHTEVVDDSDIDIYAQFDVCLCTSSVLLFIQTDVRTQKVVALAGEEKVENMLKDMINDPAVGKKCDFPEHSMQKYGREHGCKSCDFTCEDSWEKEGDQCSCKYPKVKCQGKCADACASPSPHRHDEDIDAHARIEIHEVVSYQQARQTCDPFDTICGDASKHWGYNCCNILEKKKNCGGCVWPDPFDTPQGRGVATVAR